MKKYIILLLLFGICIANVRAQSPNNDWVAEYIKVLDHKDSTMEVAAMYLKEAVDSLWMKAVATNVIGKEIVEEKNERYGKTEYLKENQDSLSFAEWKLANVIKDYEEVVLLLVSGEEKLQFTDSIQTVRIVDGISTATISLFSETDYLVEKIRHLLNKIESDQIQRLEDVEYTLALIAAYQIELDAVGQHLDQIILVNDYILNDVE